MLSPFARFINVSSLDQHGRMNNLWLALCLYPVYEGSVQRRVNPRNMIRLKGALQLLMNRYG